jgi:hypothetical protein
MLLRADAAAAGAQVGLECGLGRHRCATRLTRCGPVLPLCLCHKPGRSAHPAELTAGVGLAQAALLTMTGTRCARLPAPALARAQHPRQDSVPGRSCPLETLVKPGACWRAGRSGQPEMATIVA